MTSIVQYIQYWKELIAKHKHIKQVYRFNPDEIADALRHKVQYPFLMLNDYEGQIRTEDNGNTFYDVQHCTFVIFGNIRLQDYDDEHTQLSNFKKWGLGLLAYINDELKNSFHKCPLAPYMLDLNSIKYYITEFEEEHNKGVVFEFDLIDYHFDFNVDKNDFL